MLIPQGMGSAMLAGLPPIVGLYAAFGAQLAYTPDVQVGDYVVVHVGFALSRVDEAEAARTLEYLREMDDLGELDIPQPA